MPKPPKPPRIKKSVEIAKEDYEEVSRLGMRNDTTWAEMHRRVLKMGIIGMKKLAK